MTTKEKARCPNPETITFYVQKFCEGADKLSLPTLDEKRLIPAAETALMLTLANSAGKLYSEISTVYNSVLEGASTAEDTAAVLKKLDSAMEELTARFPGIKTAGV